VYLLVAALLIAGQNTADTLQARKGLFLGLDLGPGYVNHRCNGCDQIGSAFALRGQLRLGTVISQHATVGVNALLWRNQHNEDGALDLLATFSVYPRATGGAFLSAGVGLERFRGEYVGESPREHGTGPVISIGAGYDARFSRQLSLTPVASFQYSDIGATAFGTRSARSGVRNWLLSVGIGFTWH
jgi:hypothetical protein